MDTTHPAPKRNPTAKLIAYLTNLPRWSRTDAWAAAIVACYAIVIVVLGYYVHPIMTAKGENDGYVDRASQLLQGEIPVDAYRPLFYPILVAGTGYFTDDTFVAAKLVSHMAAIVLLLATYLLGKRCFGPKAALVALLLLVVNFHFFKAGVLAATDMLFAALTTVTLLFATRHQHDLRSIVMLAFFFALSYFTRYTAVALLPVVLFALLLNPDTSLRKSAIQVGIFLFASAFFLLPHFALTIHTFGQPFYSLSWKSVAYKLYGNGDWSYFSRAPFDGLAAVVLHDPTKFALAAFEETVNFLTRGIIKISGNGYYLTGLPLLAAFAGGLFLWLRKPTFQQSTVLLHFSAYTAMVCVFYLALPRLMVTVLPLTFLFAGYFILFLANEIQQWRPHLGRPAMVCVGLLIAAQTPPLARALWYFADEHPVHEVEAARDLAAKYGSKTSLLATYRHMAQHVRGARIDFLDDSKKGDLENKAAFYARLQEHIRAARPQFFITGRVSLGERPKELLLNIETPPNLSSVLIGQDVTVYRILEAPP